VKTDVADKNPVRPQQTVWRDSWRDPHSDRPNRADQGRNPDSIRHPGRGVAGRNSDSDDSFSGRDSDSQDSAEGRVSAVSSVRRHVMLVELDRHDAQNVHPFGLVHEDLLQLPRETLDLFLTREAAEAELRELVRA